MIKKIKTFSERSFVRHILTLATGTAAAQLITIAFSPLITRLYSPEVFGLQGVFMSLAGVLATIAALTYPMAIVLPADDSDAKALVKLSILIGIAISAGTGLIIAVFEGSILETLNSEGIAGLIYLLPIFMMVSVLSAVAGQWLARKNSFKVIAKVSVWQSLVVNSAKMGAGTIQPSAIVLITTQILGNLLQVVLLIIGIKNKKREKSFLEQENIQTGILEVARRHKDFPFMRAPQVFINAISHSLPIMMLATFFGPAAAGFYALSNSVLGMPSNLIGAAVSQVFYPKVNEAHIKGQPIDRLIAKTTLGMAAIGITPFLLIIFAGPYLFKFIFGPGWETAGIYAQWLAPWFFLNYINKPAIAAIPVLKIQKWFLLYELFSTGSKIVAILFGYFYFKNEIAAIALFSISGVFAYAYLIIYVVYYAKKSYCRLETG
jgi:O-antigen/teichoic acid export membrane protein